MSQSPPTVSPQGRYIAVTVAFLGWMCAGVQLGTLPIASLSISKDLMDEAFNPAEAAVWFGRFTAALSLGAACGGIFLGWLGDRIGRARAMAVSILCYTGFAGAAGFSQSQEQLLVLRFLAGLGIGGMWPNGVSLVAEIWPDVSRPFLAGVMGTSANCGMLLISVIGKNWNITPESWRWLLFISATPALLGLLAFWIVPESPKWLATRGDAAQANPPQPEPKPEQGQQSQGQSESDSPPARAHLDSALDLSLAAKEGGEGRAEQAQSPPVTVPASQPTLNLSGEKESGEMPSGDPVSEGVSRFGRLTNWMTSFWRRFELFRPPLLRRTLVGIALASIPLIAAWSAGRWLTPWADQVAGAADPKYKASTQFWWAFGAALGSFFGGQIASLLGRRLTYFLISLFSAVLTVGIFLLLKPLEPLFLPMVFIQGLVATLFFGWLPLCLPELFPTRVRASGAGLSYNFGRFLVAGAVLGTGALTSFFGGDYAKAGAIMGLIYGLGMIAIWFAPDTTGKKLED